MMYKKKYKKSLKIEVNWVKNLIKLDQNIEKFMGNPVPFDCAN